MEQWKGAFASLFDVQAFCVAFRAFYTLHCNSSTEIFLVSFLNFPYEKNQTNRYMSMSF